MPRKSTTEDFVLLLRPNRYGTSSLEALPFAGIQIKFHFSIFDEINK